MKRSPTHAVLALIATLAAVWAAPVAASRLAPPAAPLDPVAGEVIVQFKADAPSLRRYALAARPDAASARATATGRAATLGARHRLDLQAGAMISERTQVVRHSSQDARELAQRLAQDPEVEYAVPNGRQRRLAAPDDPLYAAAATGLRPRGPDSGQWYLRAPDAITPSAIGIEAAWQQTRGRPDVVVAVLDSGVRFDHPDLGRAVEGGALLPGYDMVSDATVANDGNGRDGDPSDPGDWVTLAESRTTTFRGCDPADSSWHGTSTASLVAALTDNGIGMAGTAPGVRVLPMRVLGKCYGSDDDIIAGIRWAAGLSVPGMPNNPHPARVLNLSLGSPGACTRPYQDAIDEVVARGVTVVAAAGNSTGGAVGTPASCTGVIAVLALRHVGTKVGFSDLGPEIAIAAPGGNCVNIQEGQPCLYPILAATNSGLQGPTLNTWSDSQNATVGTSFASPLVAGVAALMISTRPDLGPADLRAALQASARPFPRTGADNGPDDPTPVATCRSPSPMVEQLQCYCTTALCGAGMLDAGAAVAATGGPLARIAVLTEEPTAGRRITLSASTSVAGSGSTLRSFRWELVNGGGIVFGFDSDTDRETVTLTPTGSGRFTVRLTVTDDRGDSRSVSLGISVLSAPFLPLLPIPDPGGGAITPLWLLALLLAATALRLSAPRRRD